MRIYKIVKAQQGTLPELEEYEMNIGMDIHDYFELYDQNLIDMVSAFEHGIRTLEWNPVSIDRLKPVYRNFMTKNYLDHRDVKALHSILRDIIELIARLRASTDLCLHGTDSIESLFERAGYTWDESKASEFFEEYMDFHGTAPVSDYGLEPLEALVNKVFNSNSAREQLVLLNQILDVIHRRNDLSAFLVQGGQEALTELSTMEI